MISEGSIRFYFDLTSPYSYLAFHKLQQYAKLWKNVQILYYPASLGAIMKSASNSPPGQNLMRKEWLRQDIPRAAKMWQVPFTSTWPSPFPITTLGPNRFLLEVGKTCGQNALIHAIGRLFDNYWTDPCVNPCDASSLKASLPAPFTETEFQEILTRSKSPEGKQALMQTTQDALDKGAFGLPYMVVSKTTESGVSSEITVFGSDRFDHLGWFLEQDCCSGLVVSKL